MLVIDWIGGGVGSMGGRRLWSPWYTWKQLGRYCSHLERDDGSLTMVVGMEAMRSGQILHIFWLLMIVTGATIYHLLLYGTHSLGVLPKYALTLTTSLWGLLWCIILWMSKLKLREVNSINGWSCLSLFRVLFEFYVHVEVWYVSVQTKKLLFNIVGMNFAKNIKWVLSLVH